MIDGYALVTIAKSDVAFESNGCGEWSSDLSPVLEPGEDLPNGTLIVGVDVQPGTYKSGEIETGCYWARTTGFGGTLNQIIANNISTGPTLVRIPSTDKGFVSNGCGGWTRRK